MLAALLLGVAAPPARAATKIIDIREHDVTVILGPVDETRCGITDTFTVPTHEREGSFVLWDNGVSLTTSILDVKLVDSSGNTIAKAPETMLSVTGTGSLPAMVQVSVTATCTATSGARGLLEQVIFGFTISNDGTFVEFHLVN